MKRLCLLIILYFLMISCSLGRFDTMTVTLPALPPGAPALEENSEWILKWISPGQESESLTITFTEGKRVEFPVEKETPVVCLLYPPCESSEFHPRPAGGLFMPGEESVILAEWYDGAGCDFLFRAVRGGFDPAVFHCRRFLSEIREKGISDPWLIDWALLERKLYELDMKSWYIRSQFSFSIEGIIPEGVWYSSSLYLPPMETRSDSFTSLELPMGDHYFYEPVRKTGIIFSVDEKGHYYTALF